MNTISVLACLGGILAVALLLASACVVIWFGQIIRSIIRNWSDITISLALVCCIIGPLLWFKAETEIAKVWGGYTGLLGIVFGVISLIRFKRRTS